MCAVTASASDGASELLERARQLEALADLLIAVRSSSRGRVVLISGEAGVGKTALARRFCDERSDPTRVLWGACDALFTPRPLGPLLEIAEDTGGALGELISSAAGPHAIAAALIRELEAGAPTVVVLEDVHWADEATLDVLRLLGRRVEATSALVLATYRDDELGRVDPLRIVLGELASRPAVDRIELSPLSPAAVARLAEREDVDSQDLYRKTGGNPFFVTEVLAAGTDEIPPTVRDAVLARLARLGPPARTVIEALAVLPQRAPLWLLKALTGELVDYLDECLTSGMLVHGSDGVAFRHELARVAVEDALPPIRAAELHRRALAALAAPPGGLTDVARLAHHAEAAGDAEAAVRFARAAGAQAAELGAHREAAAQYARALRFARGLPLDAEAELLGHRSYQCFLTYQFDAAIDARRRAVECHRRRSDIRREGEALLALAQLLWHTGRTGEAHAVASEAVSLLERLPAGRELAMAYSTRSQLCMNAQDAEGTIVWGRRAIELADRVCDTAVRVHALINLGAMEFQAGTPGGRENLERSLQLARQARLPEQVARAFTNLAWAATRHRLHALADQYLDAGLAYFAERDLPLWPPYLLALRARSLLDRGAWTSAAETATRVVERTRATHALDRPLALAVQGLARARRGEPGAWPALDEALALVQPTGELQRIGPVAAARAEALWLEGRVGDIAAATDAALELAGLRQAGWEIGELACWRRRAGIREELPPSAEPYELQLAGAWLQAGRRWTELGCPYEAAMALADATENEEALRSALVELQRLGARPAAAIVARRLRAGGARGLPRGPRPATRANPASLTPRELEVLGLIAQGLRNADIAERLVLSEKTIDHHVSAILRKLAVKTRREASAEATRLGLTGQDR